MFFVSAVSLIYGVAAKLGDILNPVYFQRLALAIKEYSFEHSLQNTNTQLRILIDRVFGFRKVGILYLPRLRNVALISLVLSVIVIWPILADRLDAPVFDPLYWDLLTALMFKIPMAVLTILVDYFAFAKSRTILSIADRTSSAPSIIAVVACDAIVSIVAAATLWFLPDLVQDEVVELGLPAPVLLAVLIPFKLAAYCAAASGALIVILFGIVALMNYVILWITRLDKIKAFATRFLNFEQKPHLAAAALIIILFTAVYWPAVLIMNAPIWHSA